MAPPLVKQYSITGVGNASNQHLELQHEGLPILYINTNNKYGPWRSPYVTLSQHARNGPIIGAAKMGYPGCKRGFRVFLGNPDCSDLGTWPQVKCKGAWAHEYRYSVKVHEEDGREREYEFAWRRTRDKEGLGASSKGHRDFKLIAIGTPTEVYRDERPKATATVDAKEMLNDSDEEDCTPASLKEIEEKKVVEEPELVGQDEQLVAVYVHDATLFGTKRTATINWFQSLPAEAELWCLAAVLGLQEKITTNKQSMAIGYYGALSVTFCPALKICGIYANHFAALRKLFLRSTGINLCWAGVVNVEARITWIEACWYICMQFRVRASVLRSMLALDTDRASLLSSIYPVRAEGRSDEATLRCPEPTTIQHEIFRRIALDRVVNPTRHSRAKHLQI